MKIFTPAFGLQNEKRDNRSDPLEDWKLKESSLSIPVTSAQPPDFKIEVRGIAPPYFVYRSNTI